MKTLTKTQIKEILEKYKGVQGKQPRTKEKPGLTEEAKKFVFDC